MKKLVALKEEIFKEKSVENQEINDPDSLTKHNYEAEFILLEEQQKFNESKIVLEEIKDQLEIVERTISLSHKKIDAVKKEMDKVSKQTKPPCATPPKPNNIAKIFSNPPPIIQNTKILQNSTDPTTRSGFLSYFRRK